jgi:hypothetical protein
VQYLSLGRRSQIGGQTSFFEIQILPTQSFLELKQSTNHQHYEILRGGLSDYQKTVTPQRTALLQKLGEWLGQNLIPDLSNLSFGEFRIGRSTKPNIQKDNEFVLEQCLCRDVVNGTQPIYFDWSLKGAHAIHPYITNGKLRVGDYVALWTEQAFDLRGKTVTFNFSYGPTGRVTLALGTEAANHRRSPGDNFTLYYGAGIFWVRKAIYGTQVACQQFPKVGNPNGVASFTVSDRQDPSKGWKVTVRAGPHSAEVWLNSANLRIGILSWIEFSDAEIRSIRIN